jgi:hypothetical protein
VGTIWNSWPVYGSGISTGVGLSTQSESRGLQVLMEGGMP